ncbi:FecR family protein [Psychroserpens mesophilus]|uniref:FecR family protein n=1 Tax=Psychroserpens mesophilus TaxID=325473 RepID=UPI003F49745E
MNKEDLIRKWLNNELTPAEKQLFEQGEDFKLNQAITDGAKQFKASHFSKPNTFKDLQSNYRNENQKSKQLHWFKPILKIASVVIITLGIYVTFFKSNQVKIETLVSQQTTIELPDHSSVILNSGSQLTYNKNDWESQRKLQLQGEAFFKVAKGNTFEVITSQGVVTVVGTEFNVKQRENYFEVQCFEGIVKVSSQTYLETLLAGDTFRLLNNEFSQDNTTASQPEWTQNQSRFKAVPLKVVIAELQRQYDMTIIVEHINEDRLFTGGFEHDNIENALLSITQPMDLSYKTNAANEVIIYGNKE